MVSSFSVIMFNRKRRFILPDFGFEISPGYNMWHCDVLTHATGHQIRHGREGG
jgi:hypothetical protein